MKFCEVLIMKTYFIIVYQKNWKRQWKRRAKYKTFWMPKKKQKVSKLNTRNINK